MKMEVGLMGRVAEVSMYHFPQEDLLDFWGDERGQNEKTCGWWLVRYHQHMSELSTHLARGGDNILAHPYPL